MIIADADVWVDFLEKPSSNAAETLDRLIEERQAAIAGPTIAELVRGTHTEERFRELVQLLSAVPFVHLERAGWLRAGRIAEDLDRTGTPIPLNDVYIAAAAIEGDHEVFTRDKHFERIPGLRIYRPDGGN